jgi:DNA-binding LytR/AlgR family response regulator
MTTAIVVEDEAPQREELLAMLAKLWPELDVVQVCSDGLQAIDAIAEYDPDVLFLDIRIPGISGLEIGKRVAATGETAIVFTTAYDHYAVEAFNQRAVDYLLKPIQTDRLHECIARLKTRFASSDNASRAASDQREAIATIDNSEAKAEPLRWIMANVVDAIKMVSVDDVLFFQSQDKYTRVVTPNLDTHIRTPLKELIQGLDEQLFWVIHRSAIVRVDAIDKVTRDDSGRLFVKMKYCNETLPVSLAYQGRFKTM